MFLKQNQTTHHLILFNFQPLWWLEKLGIMFLTQKPIFQPIEPKHLGNILGNLINLFMV
jgi:hypothetical protein